MKKLHGKTKLRSMFALFLSVVLLISNVPIKVLGESIGGTDSSIIENMEDNPITEETDGDEDNPITENPTEELNSDEKDVDEEGEAGAFVLDLASLNSDFSKINANDALMKFLAKDVEVDMNDPVIGQVAEELDDSGMMKRSLMTADESSETKELSEEEKAKILEMFAGYLQNYAASAPVLGVQLPFFLNENDNEEDGLGVLGEMLVLAGNTVAEVRDGEQTYDEISGMILTLMLGDQLGVHCYEDVIIGLRDEALKAVEESSAKTEAQKLLVLNDWLATKVTFNMSYIMNADGSEAMQAEEPQPHNNHDTVYGTVYNMYKEAILEDLKNAAKEQYPYEIFLGDLEGQVGAEYFASMTEEDKEAAYENAILDILASEDFTEGLGGVPYEEFVESNAKMAADGLTPAIFNYWEGSIFGTLGEGSAVCLGYSRAYAYLVQCLNPEIYLKEGNDLNSADNWKSNKDIYFDENNEIDIDKGYLVDAVRITFDANVTMFGQTQEGFNSDHFWNAIRVDGQWYYIDPSYNDVYVEVMIRDRVETDGNMSHLYFLLSDTTTRELYEGNYSKIKTLYEGVATDDSYEDSWMVRSISNIFSDKNYFYYVYSSQDLIDQLRENNSESNNFDSSMNNDYEYKLVRHKITDDVDIANTDTDFDSLIEFNYRESEDDKESYARVWNGSEMVKDDYLTALYAEHKAMTEIYPSITISTVLHNKKLYFNLSNLILSYDLEEKSYAIEKEMGTISLTRDKTVAFGGMSFSYADGKSESADFVLDNHPVAAIALGKDGQLKVSMATNLAYISGKDDGEYKDDLSTIRQGAYTEDREGFYGYAFEETNYNTAYSTYSSDKYEGFVNEEINDNDEFMWVANAVNQYQFSELAGTSTEGKDFIGVLCKDEEHAYVEHDEIYFTKDDDLEWNTGTSYVCVTCGHSVFEPTEPTDMMIGMYPEIEEEYQRKLDAYEAAKEESKKSYKLEGAQWADDYTSVTFSTLNCKYSFDDYQLDSLYDLKPVELDEPIVIDVITKTENDDGSITYTADSSTIEDYYGYEYYVSVIVDKDGNVVDPDPTDPVDPDPTDPVDPDPTDPVDPDPTDPVDPDPTDPVDPDPTDPVDPDPTDPVDPDPTDPVDPDPTDPVDPDPTDPVYPDPTDPTVKEPGWLKDGDTWYYVDDNGEMETGWIKVDNTWYYMSNSGAMQTGWNKVGTTWYYMNSSGAMQTGWNKVGTTWYYMNSSGAMQTGWQKINGSWYYLDSSGAMNSKSGWNKIGNNWYYQTSSGAMDTGWRKVGNNWYYMKDNAIMQTGWTQVGSTWYYMNSSGAMQTGWTKVGSTWYYMSGSGAMQTGWTKVGSTWYYMNSSGAMQTGWIKLGRNWYYLNSNGSMQTQNTTINGKWYQFDSSGRML